MSEMELAEGKKGLLERAQASSMPCRRVSFSARLDWQMVNSDPNDSYKPNIKDNTLK